jgi:hypothetical protein
MNDESDSDWDSMSEAPVVQQATEVRYPPPSTQPKQKPETAKKMPADLRHPPPAAAPTPKPRPPDSLPPPEAKADSRLKAAARPQERQGLEHKKKPKGGSKNQALEDTFIDLNEQQSYVDSGLGSSPEKDGALRGLENPSYDGEDGEEHDSRGRQEYRLPVPEERIALLPFDEMRMGYLQVELEDEGLLVDRVLPPLVHCCSRASAELLGLLKLPLIIIFVVLGQVGPVLPCSGLYISYIDCSPSCCAWW